MSLSVVLAVCKKWILLQTVTSISKLYCLDGVTEVADFSKMAVTTECHLQCTLWLEKTCNSTFVYIFHKCWQFYHDRLIWYSLFISWPMWLMLLVTLECTRVGWYCNSPCETGESCRWFASIKVLCIILLWLMTSVLSGLVYRLTL